MERRGDDGCQESRRAKRGPASFVEYCHVEGEDLKKIQAFTENISTVGICIFLNEKIEEGSLLSITIYLLDGSEPIEAKGRVKWMRLSHFLNVKDKQHFDAGIEFVEIADEDRSKLLYYSSRAKDEFR